MVIIMPHRHTRAYRVARLAASHKRTDETNRTLGILLALIAGSLNAGGLLLLSQYISHMTGHLSNIADGLATSNLMILFDSLSSITGFILGAALASAMIVWGQINRVRLCYALPLGVQGVLLAALSLIPTLPNNLEERIAIIIVCFVMGLQNATITRISGAKIRTSHATGLITDMGIEIGRAIYHTASSRTEIDYDGNRLWLYVQLVLAFILGGVMGAIGYGLIGWNFAIPPGLALIALAIWTSNHQHKLA